MNGEGIAYAMESGRLAAEIVAQALAEPAGARRERVLEGYPKALNDTYGGYYTLGRVLREGDRSPVGDEALHPPRPAAPDADAVLPEAAREPRRADRVATPWTASSPASTGMTPAA